MMIFEILLRVVAALLVLAALFGFGEVLCGRLKLRLAPFQSATVGLCCFLVAGGLLGALGLYLKPVIAVEILGGVCAAVYCLLRRLREGTGTTEFKGWLSALPFVAASLLVLLTAQHAYWFLQGDDMQGYLPLIRKLSDTGVLGDASFSEKRFFDLGGVSVLQAVFFGWFGASAVNLADLGVGGLLVLGLIGEQAVKRRYGILWCVVLAVVPMMINEDARPISPILFMECISLFLCILLLEDAPLKRGHFILWGLAAAALTSLKSTSLIILAVLSVAIFLIAGLGRRWGRAVEDSLAAAVVGAACLAPYLYTSMKYYGVLLYPIFGTGYQDKSITGLLGQSQATAEAVLQYIFTNQQLEIVLVIAAGVALYGLFRGNKVHLIRNLAFAAALAILVWDIVWAGFAMGESVHGVRYALPYYSAIMLALLLDWRIASLGSKLEGWVLAAGLAIAIPWCARDPDFSHPSIAKSDLAYGLTRSAELAAALFSPIFSAEEGQAEMTRLQKAADPGTRMLVFVDRPYQLDFARNRIETADCPGRVSPPPGLPLTGGDSAIVSYLRTQGVRYLAYSYADGNNYSPELLDMRMKDASDPWGAYCARGMYLMHGFLGRARGLFHVVYDDGSAFLVDLNQVEHADRPL